MEQHLDPGLARNSDPTTSHDAARTINATVMEELVLRALREYGPGTSEDIAERTGQSLVTVSPRLKPLETKGLVVKSGKSQNKSGRSAIRWRVA